jgi:hypothetical protein
MTIQIKCESARNNHTRDKFHSHLRSKLHFLDLKHYKYFTLYNYMKNEKSYKSSILTSIEFINRTIKKSRENNLKTMGTICTQFRKDRAFFAP